MHTRTPKWRLGGVALALAVTTALAVGAAGALANGREDYGKAAIDYTLIASDYDALTLTLDSRLGGLLPPNPITPGDPHLPPNPIQPTLTVSFSDATTLLLAPLDRYQPGDPCRELAETYNATAISVDSSPYLAVSNYADQKCTARVRISLSTLSIRSFQPIP